MDALEVEVARRVELWRARIAGAPGRHVALQLVWDGDSSGGWFLCAELISDGRTIGLDTLQYGGDLRLLNGQVPPWPEAVVGGRAGAQLARELGLALHFPSPEHPDDDCVTYPRRHEAVPCDRCGKALTPERAPRCHPCKVEVEHRARLHADQPGHQHLVFAFVEEAGQPVARLQLAVSHTSLGFAEGLRVVLEHRSPPELLWSHLDTTLDGDERAALARWCAADIDARLPASPRAADPRAATVTFDWRGVLHRLDSRLPETRLLEELLAGYALASRGSPVHLVGNAGLSQRDARLLRVVGGLGGLATASQLAAAVPDLGADDLEATVKRLVGRGLAVREGAGLRLTAKGTVVQVPGPDLAPRGL